MGAFSGQAARDATHPAIHRSAPQPGKLPLGTTSLPKGTFVNLGIIYKVLSRHQTKELTE